MTASFKPVAEQLAYLKKGVAEIIREDELKARLEKSFKTGVPLRVYLGVDPTAPDIHLGHTVVLRKLKHFQDMGHTAIFLIGDFSAMIGDPTGRSETRPPLSREEVDANAKTYLDQVFKILDKDKTEVRYNSEWLDKLSSYDIVRLCGHYQLSRLLEREDFRSRLESGQAFELRRRRREALRSRAEGGEATPQSAPDFEARRSLAPTEPSAATTATAQPISVHELLYPLLTAYDAVSLKSDVELGATEQKFNLLVHRDIQREYGLEGEICVTMPILVGLDGSKKMSKSLGNYVGITEPPAEIFGKMMSIPDDLMWSYYELVTDRTPEEVAALKAEVSSGKLHPMDAKMRLGREVVSDFHGADAGKKAAENFQRVFRDREAPTEMKELRLTRIPGGLRSIQDVNSSIAEIITINLPSNLEKWSKILASVGLISSASEAERLIKQKGFEINGKTIEDPAVKLDADQKTTYELRVGKKKFVRLVIE